MWTPGQCFTQHDSKLWWYDFAFEKLLKLWWRIFDHTPFWSLKFRQKLEVISDLWKRYSPCGPPVASQVSLSHYLTVLNISNSRPRDNIEKGSKLFRIIREKIERDRNYFDGKENAHPGLEGPTHYPDIDPEHCMIKISKIIFHMSFYPAYWILNDENIEEYYVYCTCFHSLTLMLKIEPLLLRLRSTEAFLATAWLKKINIVFDINK